jgi:alkylation response protein AidB-like acyl-CoA dehydrogenase
MDFGLSEDQQLFVDALRGWLGEHAPLARVREIMESDAGHDPDLVSGLAGQGVAGIVIPDDFGGAGLGLLDATIAAIEFGRAVTPFSFHSSWVAAPLAISLSKAEAQKQNWLPRIASGSAVVAFATDAPKVVAGKLSGRVLFVPDAAVADAFVVVTGAGDDREAWLLERGDPGLAIDVLATVDDTRRVGELIFEGIAMNESRRLVGLDARSVDRVLDAARIVLAADAFGAAERALEEAVAYAMTRKQFRRIVASFQGVKHICAAAYAEIEPLRAFLWYAAFSWDERNGDAARMAALVKAHASDAATSAVTTAVQVFGGMGFTWECDAHLWFKRVGYDRQMFGGPAGLRASVCSRSISSAT